MRNTLASFRRAAEEYADFVELDVQKSSDGVVLVAHDRDLMKVARSPLQIWSSPAQQLREVDIGSYFSAEFRDESGLRDEGVASTVCPPHRDHDITAPLLNTIYNKDI